MTEARSIIKVLMQAIEDAVTVALGRCERMGRPGLYVCYKDDEGNTIIKLFKGA